jgi:hypothetical protein
VAEVVRVLAQEVQGPEFIPYYKKKKKSQQANAITPATWIYQFLFPPVLSV